MYMLQTKYISTAATELIMAMEACPTSWFSPMVNTKEKKKTGKDNITPNIMALNLSVLTLSMFVRVIAKVKVKGVMNTIPSCSIKK